MDSSERIFFLFAVVFLSWWVGSVVAQDASMTVCVKKLLPCQPYLHGSEKTAPPAMCCDPLKEMVGTDAHCLCAVFKSLSINQTDALALVKACGAVADISVCKNATTPTGSPATSGAPADAAPPAGSSSNSTGGSTAKSSAKRISNPGGFTFMVALIISAFY